MLGVGDSCTDRRRRHRSTQLRRVVQATRRADHTHIGLLRFRGWRWKVLLDDLVRVGLVLRGPLVRLPIGLIPRRRGARSRLDSREPRGSAPWSAASPVVSARWRTPPSVCPPAGPRLCRAPRRTRCSSPSSKPLGATKPRRSGDASQKTRSPSVPSPPAPDAALPRPLLRRHHARLGRQLRRRDASSARPDASGGSLRPPSTAPARSGASRVPPPPGPISFPDRNGSHLARSTTHTPTKLFWHDAPSSLPSCVERSASLVHDTSTASAHLAGSHRQTFRNSDVPVSNASPSGVKSIDLTPVASTHVSTMSNVSRSQNLTVLSALPVATRSSFG